MLYDPKWEQKTKADPLTLGALIAWLEQQPCAVSYPATDPTRCLLAQWLKTMDPEARMAGYGGSFVYQFRGQDVCLKQFLEVIFDRTDLKLYTFGDALKRARAFAANQ